MVKNNNDGFPIKFPLLIIIVQTGIAMETPVAKWFLHYYSPIVEEFGKYNIQKTLEEESSSSIGMSTNNEEIVKMIELFTSSSHVYQVSGLDEHLVGFSLKILTFCDRQKSIKNINSKLFNFEIFTLRYCK